jgi:hypothetical protein
MMLWNARTLREANESAARGAGPTLASTARSRRQRVEVPFYRLISQSVAAGGENVRVSQQLPTLDKGDSYWQYALDAYVGEIRIADAPAGRER